MDLDKKPNFLQKLFKQSRDTLQEFYFDSQNIEQKMDSMAAAVVKQEDTLARNIVSAELLIEDNTKSIEHLVGVIAFIEASQKKLVSALRLYKRPKNQRQCYTRLSNKS